METKLNKNWYILQDVYDTCEDLGLPKNDDFITEQGPQISEWEPLEELKQLQLVLSEHPYWGRDLRYFNSAPWWYRNEFEVDSDCDHYELYFSNVDYYCKVWLNGIVVGSHEGYSAGFKLNIDKAVVKNGVNRLIVKVWSPWETDVANNEIRRRTFKVERNMVKGTYEHSDTFVARDVNPVGIYGEVVLRQFRKAWFEQQPDFSYKLDDNLRNVSFSLSFNAVVRNSAELCLVCRDHITGEICHQVISPVLASGGYTITGQIKDIVLWNLWDRGTPYTYDIEAILRVDGQIADSYTERTGFRTVELERTEDETTFFINGERVYVRGTSYFPDNYVSAMNRSRYIDDIRKMISLGFNFIRVHVHIEYPEFYQLCTEYGIGVIQDSEYNWTHPSTDEYAKRFISVFLENVDQLKKYPSVLCWICMNEPGSLDASKIKDRDNTHSIAMEVSPGPALYAAVLAHDPTRPAIKGSYCENDLTSGDSHNYIGSLCGEDGHYSDIYGMREKFNTEYGFDAPPCIENLRKAPAVFKRLNAIEGKLDSIWDYQYKLLKYYTEYYRIQKYDRNSGYVQFLFNDIGPTSFYGLYDWWGNSKKGAQAMAESNMPIGIFAGYKDKLDSVYVVNDYNYDLGACSATIVITDVSGKTLYKDTVNITLGKDCIVKAVKLDKRFADHINVALVLKKNKKILATNKYEDIYNMPVHVKGHPGRMSHEFGIRLYDC